MKKLLFQNHSVLAPRLWSMAQALRASNGYNPTKEQLDAAEDLENRSAEHNRQVYLFGRDRFLMNMS